MTLGGSSAPLGIDGCRKSKRRVKKKREEEVGAVKPS